MDFSNGSCCRVNLPYPSVKICKKTSMMLHYCWMIMHHAVQVNILQYRNIYAHQLDESKCVADTFFG